MDALHLYADAARSVHRKQLLHRPRRALPPALLMIGTPACGWSPLARGLGIDRAPQSGPVPGPAEMGIFQAVGAERLLVADFWTDRRDGLLFLFHLHGFAELARYCGGPRSRAEDAFWEHVVRDWLARNGRPAGPGWHPYPTSGRIVAWCAALSRGDWPEDLTVSMRASLGRQLLLLRRSVEHDIGGNHVLRNAAALIVGGACLRDEAAQRRGLKVLKAELRAQILADGGHEERSPSYHRAVLADLEDVATLLERTTGVPPWLEAAIGAMRGWLAALAGPDGALPLLNDAWEGPPVAGSGAPFHDLADTGYLVLRHGNDQAVLDLAEVSPPHLPPHAHADVGSFVLWIDGRPLVVDPGTGRYEEPERSRLRSTAAHSTLEVDGVDQFLPWGPFRAAFLPRVRRPESMTVEHDGYRRLDDPVVHERRFTWIPGGGLVVLDRLRARRAHLSASRLPLAPGVRADDAPLRFVALGVGANPVVERAEYSPHLGRTEPIEVLVRRARLAPGEVTGWALLRQGYDVRLDGDRLTVLRDGTEMPFG